MAVLLETSKGDIVIDLFTEECPIATKNFLKLCKAKYYNNCLFFNVQRNFILQTGDPTNTGRGGSSVYGLMYGSQARFFEDEIRPSLKHKAKGMVGMAGAGENTNASQFYLTTGEDLESLDEKHTIFGEVGEGMDVIMAINNLPVDERRRPLQNIRIRHAIVLEDPFDDPPQLADHIPEHSPPPQFEHGDRIEEDWQPGADDRPAEEVEQESRMQEAAQNAVVLEMIGDLPHADAKPPSNMIFVCKLNPVTEEEVRHCIIDRCSRCKDLEIIFSRFGKVTSCDIIRDWKTGDSLCYAFIGFEEDRSAEDAYLKMNNCLIDDRRIKVDFSQSMYHLWRQFRAYGKKGTREMKKEADDVGTGNRLEMRSRNQEHGPGMPGSQYDMVFDAGELADAGTAFSSPSPRATHRRDGRGIAPLADNRKGNRQREREHLSSRGDRNGCDRSKSKGTDDGRRTTGHPEGRRDGERNHREERDDSRHKDRGRDDARVEHRGRERQRDGERVNDRHGERSRARDSDRRGDRERDRGDTRRADDRVRERERGRGDRERERERVRGDRDRDRERERERERERDRDRDRDRDRYTHRDGGGDRHERRRSRSRDRM